MLVGWGSTPYFSEYTRSGKLLFDGDTPGSPTSPTARRSSSGSACRYAARRARRAARAGATTVYASWNGATRLASWRVLAGTGAEPPHGRREAPRSGFETAIPVHGGYQSFELEALDAGGRVLGSSPRFSAQG